MSLSVGVDLIEVERIAGALERHGERFLRRVYTEREIALCAGRAPELAARFAGKEAVAKALGTGIAGFSWREVEIVSDARGKPLVVLHGRAAARAEELGLMQIEVSLSHTRGMALACAIVA